MTRYEMKGRLNTLRVIISWALCGFVAWGLVLGDFTHKFPWGDHRGPAGFAAALGPFGLFGALVACAPEHWRIASGALACVPR